MQIKCIHRRIWKKSRHGVPEWHSKKSTFYKRHRKTHKYTNARMNQSSYWQYHWFYCHIPTWVTIWETCRETTQSHYSLSSEHRQFYVDRQMLRVDIVVSLMNRPHKTISSDTTSFNSPTVLTYSTEMNHKGIVVDASFVPTLLKAK